MKRWLCLCLGILLVHCSDLAYAATSAGDGLDTLRYTELRIWAADVDVLLPLGWAEDDKELLKKESSEALNELIALKSELSSLDLPSDIEPVRAYHLECIVRMEAVYADMDKKTPEQITAGYADIRAFSESKNKDIEAIYKKYMGNDKVPDDFDSIKEETRFALSKEDADTYTSAMELIKKREFSKAADLLKSLESKYKGSAFEMVVLLRLSDCLISADDSGGDVAAGQVMLQKIVDSKTYAPVLAESFIKWRSVVQANEHGMSNMSEIPNKEYNEKRWELVQVIKEYLKTNPNDLWAQTLVKSLLAYGNIGRGGDYGNDNLMYYGNMYMDLSEKSGQKK